MRRVLVDTDVILDYLLERSEFVDASARIWAANAEGVFEGYISAITPVNVYYISRKIKGTDFTRTLVHELLHYWRVCPVDDQVLKAALTSPLIDFEDAVQHASASLHKLDMIVTRNIGDYRASVLPVLLPADFIASLDTDTT